jgi:large subunit ribosomal protein L37Ae
MAEKTKAPIKGVGARYGRTVKQKYAAIQAQQRKLHKCPYCNYIKVKRISAGIWNCNKCGKKFTSRAYTVAKAPVPRAEVLEE